jgi:hypothetical protein
MEKENDASASGPLGFPADRWKNAFTHLMTTFKTKLISSCPPTRNYSK